MVNRWIREFEADHPPVVINNFAYDRVQHQMSPVVMLTEMLGCDQGVIRRITLCKTKTTSLDLADRLIQAIQRPDAFQNGELHVIPNPQWTQEKWLAWKKGCENDAY